MLSEYLTETDGSKSTRRLKAFISGIAAKVFSIAGLILFYKLIIDAINLNKEFTALFVAGIALSFLPAILFLLESLILCYLTSWTDVKDAISTARGKNE
ncbi:MAG: hypothetical protein LBU09_03285 [Endomicrobium sp.]|jgi:predicted RND superfamily exporter protein|nr:hypothetical protein [Endomicrobium sp.]